MSEEQVITFNYSLKNTKGEALEKSEEPITIQVGQNQILPAIEEILVKGKPGEKHTTELKAAEAFGEYRKDLIFEIPKDQISDTVKVGDVVGSETQEGQPLKLTVVEIKENALVLDANHPLAGQDLNVDIEIVETQAPVLDA